MTPKEKRNNEASEAVSDIKFDITMGIKPKL
jgi:hypothetical protein